MTDIARLAVIVESREAEVAEDRLDGLAAAADRAEGEVNSLATAARGTNGPLQAMNANIVQQQRALTLARSSMGLTTQEGLNMGRQLSDVGVQMALGVSPFLIAIQQGPQVFDVFQMAAIRTGTTVRGAMMATGAAVWAAMAPLLPIIAALAAGAATVAAAWGLANRALSKGFEDASTAMGLTADQLAHLEEKGIETGVTMGDVFTGVGSMINAMLQETFGDELNAAMSRWNGFLDDTTAAAGRGAKYVLTGFLTAYYGVRDTWRLLPALMASAATQAANGAVRVIEWMVNKAREGLNLLITGAQMLSRVNPMFAPARGMSTIDAVSFGRFADGNAGAWGDAASSLSNAAGEAEAAANRIISAGRRATEAARRARVSAGLSDYEGPGGSSDGALERAARAAGLVVERMEKLPSAVIRPIEMELPRLIDPLELLADELRMIDDLARETSRGLASAWGESGRALGDLLTTMTSYESRLAEIALAEKERRITSAQADRERAMAQVQNYGDMAAAARGFFDEGSTGYRALLAIEQLYRAQQLAGMVMAMATGQQETAASVAGSMARGAASMAAGAARMFESLGPLAFPAVAAMLGLLAGLGLGSGGGASRSHSAANDNDAPGGPATANQRFAASQMRQQQEATREAMGIEVRVSADRDGLNAYVVDTAGKVAAPMAAQAEARAISTSSRIGARSLPGIQQSQRRLGTTP